MMSENQVPDVSDSASKTSPPLGIGHLLLWAACSAVLLTATLALDRITFFSQEAILGTMLGIKELSVFDSILAIIEGPAVASLLIWSARKRRGLRFPVQPGEWLLILNGVATILFVAGLAAWSLMPLNAYSRIVLLPMALMVGCYLFVAFWPPLPKWWRVAMLVICLLYSVDFGQNFLYSYFYNSVSRRLLTTLPILYLASCIFTIIVLSICAWIDRARKIQRGWLHWTGVATCISGLLLTISQVVYFEWLR